nr:HK97 family phage prohead protease [Streptococcus uberis]
MGALDSFSIGFIVKDYEAIDNKSIYSGMKIKEAELLETSIVTVPANPSATVSSVKSLDIANTIKKELEKQELIKKLEGI